MSSLSSSARLPVKFEKLSGRSKHELAAAAILSAADYPKASKIRNDGATVYIAKYDGTVVGVFATKKIGDDDLELTHIAVRSDLRTRGIGTQILEEVGKTRRAIKLVADSLAARAFYKY